MVYVTCHLPCSYRSPLVKINSQTAQTFPDARKVDQDYADSHNSARTSGTHIGYRGTTRGFVSVILINVLVEVLLNKWAPTK